MEYEKKLLFGVALRPVLKSDTNLQADLRSWHPLSVAYGPARCKNAINRDAKLSQ